MLAQLHIRDFAIVDRLDIEFNPGMTALTGETGAGKSIAIDALSIALGERADASTVKNGRERAEITATFYLPQQSLALDWLKAQELDEENECILRRTVNAEGGSRAYINGRPVPIQMVKELAGFLIDIHSQHQHQSLQRREVQRQLIDAYADQEALVHAIGNCYARYTQIENQILTIQTDASERESKIDYLQFQKQELENLSLKEGEWAELEREHALLANSEKIHATLLMSVNVLHEDEYAVLHKLESVKFALEAVAEFDPRIKAAAELLDNASIQMSEAVDEVKALQDDTDLDPARFQWIETRMADVLTLARKHRCEAQELPAVLATITNELDQIQNATFTVEGLSKSLASVRQEYEDLATKVTKGRTKAANDLSKKVKALLSQLGMAGASLEIQLDKNETDIPTAYGHEQVNFLVSTNPGQPAKAIAKVASGGELSRISLAIQVVASQVARIPTMVFDEVDVGIGGGIAEIVGELLRKLGDQRQVICITHQAQVAAQASQHLKVIKKISAKTVGTSIQVLSAAERRDELARMIGGVQITDKTLEHALEMLNRAQSKESSELVH